MYVIMTTSDVCEWGKHLGQLGGNREVERLHIEEHYDLYPSSNIFRVIKPRKIRWAVHVARVEETRGACDDLVGKPEVKVPLGRPRCRWEDNIKMDF